MSNKTFAKVFLLLIAFHYFTTNSLGQTKFATTNSKWTYHIWFWDESEEYGYAVYKTEKDTLFSGQNCKKVTCNIITKKDSLFTKPDFFFTSHDTVFYYNYDYEAFFPLYVFNVKIGDTLNLPSPYYVFGKPDSFRLVVTDVFDITINGEALKTVTTKALDHFKLPSYTEKIGSHHTFTIPEINVYYATKYYLNCYRDDLIDTNFNTGECIPSKLNIQANIKSDEDLIISPNPVQSKLNIRLKKPIEIEALKIIDILGKQVNVSTEYNKSDILIDMSQLASGIYILQLRVEGISIVRRIVKN
jgi:hypothetical protein